MSSGDIEVGGTQVPAGQRKDVEFPVAVLPTGTWLTLPVAVLNGIRPGPIIWLSAALHGDEVVGVEVIRRVLDTVRPQELTGAIVAVPIVNVFGFLGRDRYLPDRRDLNRAFPGSTRGSLAARLAHLFMNDVVSRCELGIDFHTGSDHRVNLPQIRANLDDPETRRLAAAFGTQIILHAKTRDGSLRAAANEAGVKMLLYEGGEANRFHTAAIEAGYIGALGVLDALGMRPLAGRGPSAEPLESRKTRWTRASRDGILRMEVTLGDHVQRRQIVGFIADPFGRANLPVRTSTAGIVIGQTQHPLVRRGDAIVHVAELENGEDSAAEGT